MAASTTELYEKISSNEDLVVAANARAKAAEAQLEELLKEAMTRFDYILLDGDRNRQVDIERIEFENTIAGIQNILDKYTARRRTN